MERGSCFPRSALLRSDTASARWVAGRLRSRASVALSAIGALFVTLYVRHSRRTDGVLDLSLCGHRTFRIAICSELHRPCRRRRRLAVPASHDAASRIWPHALRIRIDHLHRRHRHADGQVGHQPDATLVRIPPFSRRNCRVRRTVDAVPCFRQRDDAASGHHGDHLRGGIASDSSDPGRGSHGLLGRPAIRDGTGILSAERRQAARRLGRGRLRGVGRARRPGDLGQHDGRPATSRRRSSWSPFRWP